MRPIDSTSTLTKMYLCALLSIPFKLGANLSIYFSITCDSCHCFSCCLKMYVNGAFQINGYKSKLSSRLCVIIKTGNKTQQTTYMSSLLIAQPYIQCCIICSKTSSINRKNESCRPSDVEKIYLHSYTNIRCLRCALKPDICYSVQCTWIEQELAYYTNALLNKCDTFFHQNK